MSELLEYYRKKLGISEDEHLRNLEEAKKNSPIDKIKQRTETPQERYEQLLSNSETTVEELRFAKKEVLKNECTQAIYDGFIATNGNSYGFNEHDQANYTQQMILLMQDTDNLITSIPWKTKNNGVVEHSKSDFNQIIQDAKNHKLAMQQKYWNLEESLLATETIDGINTINWE